MSAPPIDMRPDHEVLVREILLARLPKGVRVWVFGSRATWRAKQYSDLDLALEGAEPLPDSLVNDLADEFRESDLPWKVDVLDFNAITPSFRKLIDKDKVVFSVGSEMVSAHAACGGGSRGAGWNAGMSKVELSKVVTISTHKITPDQFASDGYVSTNSMIGEAGGVEFGNSIIPQGKSTAYSYDDVLFSNIRTYFKKVWLSDREGGCSNDVLVFRATQGSIDARFLFYCLTHPEFTEYSVRTSKGTKMPRGDKAALLRYEVDLPSLPEQRAIAAILNFLDDKIDLNRRMNETLEAMARAIFKDWFVDFGPTRAKMEGRKPYLAPEIWELFPERVDGDGLPVGWEERSITEFLTIIGGGTPKTSVTGYWEGKIPWFSVADTPPSGSVFVVDTEKTITEMGLAESSARLIPKGTTIISARGTVGNLAVAGQAMTFNQSCYALRGYGAVGDCFVYLVAQHMVRELKSRAHGSVFSTIIRQTFESVILPFPGEEALRCFESVATPLFDKILASIKETRTLAQTRDLLLPKLMSGEIRLREAEGIVEWVV